MKSDLLAAVAHSLELDSSLAVMELIENCQYQLGNSQPNVGILFASIDHDHQLILDKICHKWPNLQLIGCTTDGEFSSEHGYVEDSIILTLFSSNQIKFSSGYVDNASPNLEKDCKEVLSKAIDSLSSTPKLCILFSDAINTNGETVMGLLNTITDGKLPIVGGISADSWRFNQTKQFYNNISSPTISPFILLGGDFEFSIGMDCGWEPIGDLGTVTRSEGNIVYEINNKPTLDFFKNFLGENTKPTLELPVAVYDSSGNFSFMRTSFENYNEEDGSVTFLGNIPVNYIVRITMVNRDSILTGTRISVNHAVNTISFCDSPVVALCFTCSARRVLLGTRTVEEYGLVRDIIGDKVKFAGFYTYGEFCPNLSNSVNEFHNETFVTLLLG